MDLEQLADIAVAALPRGRPRGQGAEKVRNLRPEDLVRLPARPKREVPFLQKVRTTHHFAAKMLAQGAKDIDISAATGYTPQYIHSLKSDPAFKELVEHYKGQVDAQFLNVHERLAALGCMTLEELLDRMETKPESFSNSELFEQAKVMLDRAGFGPQSKSTVRMEHTVSNDLLERIKSEITQRGMVRQLEEVVDVPLIAAE